jgi:hypothetical protein
VLIDIMTIRTRLSEAAGSSSHCPELLLTRRIDRSRLKAGAETVRRPMPDEIHPDRLLRGVTTMLTPYGQRHLELREEFRKEKDDLLKFQRTLDSKKDALAIGMTGDQINWIEECIAGLGIDKDSSPAVIARKCIGGIDEAHARDFILTNLLEAAKHGEFPINAAKRLEALGLISANVVPSNNEDEGEKMPIAQTAPLKWLQRLRSGVMTICRKLLKIGVNALLALADMTKIKIKPNVQVAPIPSLGFTVEVDFTPEISGKELFEILEPLGLTSMTAQTG